jgi:tetratricopeptide (TPR) repeat protein
MNGLSVIRRIACTAVLALALAQGGRPTASAASSAAQSDRNASSYEELIRRYQAGEADVTVRILASWSASEVDRAVRESQADESRPRIVPRSDAARDLRLVAVAGLHAEAGITSGDHERYQLHADVGEAAVKDLAARRSAVPFCRAWYLTASNFWTVLGDLVRAEAALTSARRLLGGDAELLVALGAVNEMWSGPFGAPFLKRDMSVDLGGENFQQRVYVRASRQRAALLGRARAFYQEAVAMAPGAYEARLRLGRVLAQLGHPDQAAKELEICLAPGADPLIRYLAALFLGQIREERNDLAAAEAAYRGARASVPSGFAATLALARVLDITGQADASTAIVTGMLVSPAGAARPLDPWWLYQMGQLTDLGTRLKALRALAHQP